MEKVINPNTTEWEPGKTYILRYNIQRPFGLIPFNEDQQIKDGLARLESDPRLTVLSWAHSPKAGKFQVEVLAVQPSSPVIVIAYLVAGVLALFLVKLSLDSVAEIIDAQSNLAVSESAELPFGIRLPVGSTLRNVGLLGVIGIAGFLLVQRVK